MLESLTIGSTKSLRRIAVVACDPHGVDASHTRCDATWGASRDWYMFMYQSFVTSGIYAKSLVFRAGKDM